MKKILGICGTAKDKEFSSSEYLLQVALKAAEDSNDDVTTKLIKLRDYNILSCQGCGACMNNQKCKLLENPDDQLKELYQECCDADAFIFSSPVYALGLPAMWKNWFDRCEPCDEKELDYPFYCYDVVQQVKGKAFRGKVAGQMVVSAGSGLEWALSSLMPAITAVKLSTVVSVGICLAEYDAQPAILKRPWSKKIQEADFALNIAKSVGQRVAEMIGFCTYIIDNKNGTQVFGKNLDKKNLVFENGTGETVDFQMEQKKQAVFVTINRDTIEEGTKWYDDLKKLVREKDYVLYNLVVVEQLPHFISQSTVKNNVFTLSGQEKDSFLFDWNEKFYSSVSNNPFEHAVIMIVDLEKSEIRYINELKYDEDNLRTVKSILEEK